MKVPARTIWDIKVQSVCAIVTARDGDDVELWMCGNFGQCSFDPPRVIINPNRLYPIEEVLRRERRFAINVVPRSGRAAVIRAIRIRRRAVNKAPIVGLPLIDDPQHRIPYLDQCLRTLFCEVEQVLSTGDHTVMIARVLESRLQFGGGREVPLLYPEVSGRPSRYPTLSKAIRQFLLVTGLKDRLRKLLGRGGPAKVDLPHTTYLEGGQTEREVEQIQRYGLKDRGRAIWPPQALPPRLKRKAAICVVGVGQWGAYHCRLFREADPNVELYVCGRNPERAARVARACGAKDVILGLEQAVTDPRVDAVALVLPHHLHAWGVKLAAEGGKHVLVEKPIALTLEESDRMIADARRAGVILMVAENMHFRPALREAVRAIERGDIGEPLYFKAHAGGLMKPEGWKTNADEMGGGVLMDVGVHYVRALRLLMGEPDRVLATKAQQINTKMGGEDSVQVLCSSRWGWQAHLLMSWSSPRGHSPDILVSGERGVLQIWPGDPYLELYPAEPQLLTELVSYVRPAWLSEKLTRPTFQRVRLPVPDEDKIGYLTEVRDFLAAVTEGRDPVTVPADGRRDLEIVLRAYESLRTENWAEIATCPAGASPSWAPRSAPR